MEVSDIPIGIYRYSADAWFEPELYNMDGQAGAPPDAFSPEGQMLASGGGGVDPDSTIKLWRVADGALVHTLSGHGIGVSGGAFRGRIAFNEFYREHKGKIDSTAAVNLWASSPVNMSHACDGKITDSEMAGQMVFLAHHGKVTLREKFPTAGWRYLPDLPGAEPHLSLGYSVVSPIFVADRLKAARAAELKSEPEAEAVDLNLGDLAAMFLEQDDPFAQQVARVEPAAAAAHHADKWSS